MPTYYFLKPDGEEVTLVMSFSEHDQYLANNPTHVQLLKKAPAYGDSFHYGKKPSSDFRDKLKEIKKSHPRADINTF